MSGRQVLVRIFFTNGAIETRPVNRVRFIMADESGLKAGLIAAVQQVEESNPAEEEDRLVVPINNILYAQTFLGEFHPRGRK